MWIVRSPSCNAWTNLALEEMLLESTPRQIMVLFFCVNDPVVVIGKHQNPWRECRLLELARDGARLARRISGGGAVYHDPGNLNYAFMMPVERYAKEQAFGIVEHAMALLGLAVRHDDNNSLVTKQGLKFSGTAFCLRRKRALHHGTLLLHSDLDKLDRLLNTPVDSFSTRATRSRRANVVNLGTLIPSLDRQTVENAFIASMKHAFPEERMEQVLLPTAAELRPGCERHASRAWLYDRTPEFSWATCYDDQARPAAAGHLRLTFVQGKIAEAAWEPKAGWSEPVEWPRLLLGAEPDATTWSRRVSDAADNRPDLLARARWLRKLPFCSPRFR